VKQTLLHTSSAIKWFIYNLALIWSNTPIIVNFGDIYLNGINQSELIYDNAMLVLGAILQVLVWILWKLLCDHVAANQLENIAMRWHKKTEGRDY
jgi:hypothetical protein